MGTKPFDNKGMTNQYKIQYEFFMSNLVYDEAELAKADVLLKDKFTWNDVGAMTMKKAYTKSIADTKRDISRNLDNAIKAIKRGEVEKYWKDSDLKAHGIPIP